MFLAFLLPIPRPKHSPSMVFNCRAPESNKAFTAKRWPFSQALCLRPWTETVNERGKHQGSWENIASNVKLMLTYIFPLAPVISFSVWPNKHQQKCKRNLPKKKKKKHFKTPHGPNSVQTALANHVATPWRHWLLPSLVPSECYRAKPPQCYRRHGANVAVRARSWEVFCLVRNGFDAFKVDITKYMNVERCLSSNDIFSSVLFVISSWVISFKGHSFPSLQRSCGFRMQIHSETPVRIGTSCN